jgi:signal transduction histidine kinase
VKPEFSERGLILAPQGRDAEIAAMMLGEAGIAADTCTSIAETVYELGNGAGFALVTEEALHRVDLRGLSEWLEAQPEWSDFPFILLTRRGGGLERNPSAARHLKTLGNVSFLERPFHPTTLVSMSTSALRGRRRQYEARARLLELDERRRWLTEANETLEGRVRERTSELERTHQKVLRESAQREAAEEQLRQVQKVEMIGQLTGGVAHDFNNLLTAVMGNLSLLQRHLPHGDARAQRLIEGAMEGANRGASLTQRLLAFSRRQSLQLAPADVVALVTGMKALIERSIGPEINLSFDLTTKPAVSMIDANQVELALLNLAVNARDAMPGGGDLCIGVDHAANLSADLPAGEFVRIWVSDTGHGMDAATLERAIDPFFSTKELGKGTGLGLSMVHGLAVQQNGALRLQSSAGKGTCAELYLPVTSRVAQAPVQLRVEPTAPTRRSRILLVDDDALIAMSSVDMLEDLGHEVLEANSGKQALDLLRDNAAIDLLITDFAMPGMTGAQLIEAAKSMFPDLPVLLATGYAELPGGQLNDIPRIGKPYTQPQLAREVSRLLNGA